MLDPSVAAPYRVLVLRHTTLVFTRPRELLERLQATSAPWRVYHGNEPLLATMRLFGHADVVSGYHGAGLINAVFSRHPCLRLHEVDTYSSLNASQHARRRNASSTADAWRGYLGRMVQRWKPRVRISLQLVPLEPILAANGRATDGKTLTKMKKLKHIPLSNADICQMVLLTLPGCGL